MGFFDWLKKGREHSLPSILPDEIDPQKLQEARAEQQQRLAARRAGEQRRSAEREAERRRQATPLRSWWFINSARDLLCLKQTELSHALRWGEDARTPNAAKPSYVLRRDEGEPFDATTFLLRACSHEVYLKLLNFIPDDWRLIVPPPDHRSSLTRQEGRIRIRFGPNRSGAYQLAGYLELTVSRLDPVIEAYRRATVKLDVREGITLTPRFFEEVAGSRCEVEISANPFPIRELSGNVSPEALDRYCAKLKAELRQTHIAKRMLF